jgi:hypothetical protein
MAHAPCNADHHASRLKTLSSEREVKHQAAVFSSSALQKRVGGRGDQVASSQLCFAERQPLVLEVVFRAGAVRQSAALLRGARLTRLGFLAAAAAFRDLAAAALCCLT